MAAKLLRDAAGIERLAQGERGADFCIGLPVVIACPRALCGDWLYGAITPVQDFDLFDGKDIVGGGEHLPVPLQERI